MTNELTVIGGGLAGCEAAWQAAQRGVPVRLYEMRPKVPTAVHRTGDLAELVCSNSLKSNNLDKASGLLKAEMRRLDSLIIQCADASAVAAGSALAVDRVRFASLITERLGQHPNITICRDEVTTIPETPCIVATGPLTSASLSGVIQEVLGEGFLNFFDAVAPIVDADSLDYDQLFLASRYEKGGAAYWNAPLTEAQYDTLREAILTAESATAHNEEDVPYFESCLPVEELARRGRLTMRYGALRGAGLTDPKTGRWPFACVQLRAENAEGTMYNLVGFQTRMKWPEQTRVLRLIPGLQNVEIVRYGVIHKNIFINSPSILRPTFQTRFRDDLFFAGQLTGVEGYVESAAAGLMAGINAALLLNKDALGAPTAFPRETVLGSLAHYITSAEAKHFQPMNSNWALLPPPEEKVPKADKPAFFAQRALGALEIFIDKNRLSMAQ
ncbi:MAG: methylenetetrahydrofolate--tRNA-(uracil(54)-C(5))-methyltransferase (FADH(2)-oxidizing) TrmFO [Abitibacteriaceae bacterium]|nr:methylenetetrahydrofolate--tRNA-(uracil(54)-C(5))-methyltransferase (FADH(2)-oxidizing) TrmFO [Abditibacteriaceae bacterium]